MKESIVPGYVPDRDLAALFVAIQMEQVFHDSKTFVDCIPNRHPAEILEAYLTQKGSPDFLLSSFVYANFTLPPKTHSDRSHDHKDMLAHLKHHWPYLTAGSISDLHHNTLIYLPYPFIVPGGRFREMFYWDSYFTIIGLLESGQDPLALGMIRNMVFLLDTYGHIPNGNRTYFLSRSQPPFLAEMLKCYAGKHGLEHIMEFLPALEKEYMYWTRDDQKVGPEECAVGKSVWLEGAVMHRYTGSLNEPRAEAYNKEFNWGSRLEPALRPFFYRNLRAACESGWDFSSRWFADGKTRHSIACENLVPVCLNSLLYNCEMQLACMYRYNANTSRAGYYGALASKRKSSILKYCWSEAAGMFNDFNFVSCIHNGVPSLAAVYPLFFGLATQEQADQTVAVLKAQFLFPGGLVTTLVASGEQWDYPNGWAPLQWLAVIGLQRYGHTDLAITIARRWLRINESVFIKEDKMMEKYNVVDPDRPGGGGNYENQDGFGWTNGVALALDSWLNGRLSFYPDAAIK